MGGNEFVDAVAPADGVETGRHVILPALGESQDPKIFCRSPIHHDMSR